MRISAGPAPASAAAIWRAKEGKAKRVSWPGPVWLKERTGMMGRSQLRAYCRPQQGLGGLAHRVGGDRVQGGVLGQGAARCPAWTPYSSQVPTDSTTGRPASGRARTASKRFRVPVTLAAKVSRGSRNETAAELWAARW